MLTDIINFPLIYYMKINYRRKIYTVNVTSFLPLKLIQSDSVRIASHPTASYSHNEVMTHLQTSREKLEIK